MFKIVPNPSFTAVVKLSTPGSEAPGAITFTFRHKRRRELAAWVQTAVARPSDAEFLGEVIEAWAGVVGDAGEPVPYSHQALEQLLDAYPSAGVEIYRAYLAQLQDARAKN